MEPDKLTDLEDKAWMREALKLADLAAAEGEVPVGAVIRKEVKEKEDAADIDRRRKIHEGSDPSGEKSMED